MITVIYIVHIFVWFSNLFALNGALSHNYDRQNYPINKDLKGIINNKDLVSLEKLSVSLIKFGDAKYYGLVSLGNPQQTFKVLISTGLPYFWIQSKKCSWFRISCWFHKHYDSSKSSTYMKNGKQFYIDDFNGELSGFISEDTLQFGYMVIANQTLGEAVDPPYHSDYDGVLGLAFPSETFTGKSIFTSIISKGLLKKNIFSLYFDNSLKNNNEVGQMIFGDWDEDKLDIESVEYIPLSDNTAWIFDLDFINTEDGEELCYSCQALVDTGTDLIVGHKDVVREIHKKIGADIYGTKATVGCSKIDQLPAITFSINNRNYTIRSPDYIIKKTIYFFFPICMVGIVGELQYEDKPWILGNIFLKQFYTIFDADNKQISFANMK